jgi:RNA polymerase sigma-70 factor (ECF subfamily)
MVRVAMLIEPNDSANAATAARGSETDEQLMAAFARGSADAFEALFLRYRQPLFGFFRRRVIDPSLAEELTQETFVAILRASSRYEACALFRTYLYAIAFRILRAHRRKHAFRAAFWRPSDEGHEASVAIPIETELLIRQALGRLDQMEREILMLREYEQLSYAEIAAVMSLPVNTVRSRLFRARTALRNLLDERAPMPRTEARTSEERA